MVRTWSYLNRLNFLNDLIPYRPFRKRPVYKIFKATTKLRRANLPRYLHRLNLTWFPRRKYRRRKRQTNWAPLRFIPVAWAKLYLSDRSMVRFYQTLSSLPFVSLGADPLVLIRRTSKLAGTTAFSSFTSTKRLNRRFVGDPNVKLPMFLTPKCGLVINGILGLDSESFIRGNLAAPWGLVYDNAVFSYNTDFAQIYNLTPSLLNLPNNLVLNYLTTVYRLLTLLTLHNLPR